MTTSIANITRDDAAVHIDNAATTRTVKPIEPYPEVQPVKEHTDTHEKVEPVRPRQQRRESDRRQKDDPILLDTRDGRGRRKSDHPAENDDAVEAAHIDVFT